MFSFLKNRKSLQQNSLIFNIEPTFRCNLKCPTCPRNSTEGGRFDMAPAVFSRICEELGCAQSLDLTGWGEPLLHPDITSMIRKVKKRGLPVSMTSNGTLLSENMTSELIDAGLDKLAVSVDGVTPETYEPIRKGAVYSEVCKNIKAAVSLVHRKSSPLEISLAFTIQKQNLSDLELIVPWMKEHGVEILHLKHLNVLSSHFDWQNSLLSNALDSEADSSQLRKAEADIIKIREEIGKAGFSLNFFSQLPMDERLLKQNCLAAPLNSVYFSYDGMVSPCCHLGHKVSRFFHNTCYAPDHFITGNIMQASLQNIWDSPDYRRFRSEFQQGPRPAHCETC